MQMTVGIFDSRQAAERAVTHLSAEGIAPRRINLLVSGEVMLEDIPTSETEQPGVARAVGAVVGGATGAMAGLSLAATLMLPGVGAVTAIGLAAAGVLTAIGAAGGAAVGGAVEESLQNGLPIDELYVYEDALRQGRSVLMVEADDNQQADLVREVFRSNGAESVDAAREQWWTGLRSAENAHYDGGGGDFASDESDYRRGFEVAHLPGTRGKSYDAALGYLRERYPEVHDHAAFRAGYERGRKHRERSLEQGRELTP